MMGNQVYANNMEVSCKAADGKSICAFPDVCMTPPQTPATPPGVPIPYPNTGMASDTTDGSSTVKISGQEVMLKNKSYFKRSTGDEAGCAPKKGVMTSKNTGKVYFTAWSMDVKVEGENVVRNMDLTTHNHGSNPNTGPWLYQDEMAVAPPGHPDCSGADAANNAGENFLKKEGLLDDNTVVAGGKFVPQSGPPYLVMGSNKISPGQINMVGRGGKSGKYSMWAKGTTTNPSPNVRCKKHPKGYKYRPGKYVPRSGDAESKIIEELFRTEGGQPKGTLFLKVTGRPVCCSCQGLAKCAQESGDLKIVFCPKAEFDKCP